MGRRRLALLLLLAGCASAPYTRRSQLIIVSADEEMKLGAEAYQEVLAKSRVVTEPPRTAPVEAVGRRIARAADHPEYPWQFALLEDAKQQNAFALPGGKVAVYTGLL